MRVDMSVGERLAIGAVVVALLIAMLGTVVAASVARVTELQRIQREVITPRAQAADDLEKDIYQQAIAFRNYAITSAPADLQAFNEDRHAVNSRLQTIGSLPMTAEGEALFKRMIPTAAEHQHAFETFISLAAAGATRETLRTQELVISGHRTRLLQLVGRFAALQSQQSEQATAAIKKATDDLQRTVVVVTLLILGVSVLTPYIVARAVRRPASRLVAAAEALSGGSFDEAVALQERSERAQPFRDELHEAAHVFGRMAETLKKREDRLAAHSRLSIVLGRSLDPGQVASEALRELTAHVGAEAAAVYVCESDGSLRPLATAGLGDEVATLRPGAGIPGRAVAERRPQTVRDIPPDTPFRIGLGIDSVPPRCVAAAPMMVKDHVLGVIVVASLHDLDDEAMQFVEGSAGQLAISLDNALSHVRIAGLATALQENNETLQAQNEELQAQQEELQVQNEELQAQSEELRTQADELQAQSEELRAQQDSLTRSNQALARAEEQKNRFLAMLGHELRNPLAAVAGAATLLDGPEGGGATSQATAHEVIKRQTAHLARLLDDLLDIGRITSGKIVLARRPLDLAATVARCVSTIRNGHTTGPAVTVDASEPVWIDADETRIEQIISNLVTNAIKFTPSDGTVAVVVRSENGEAVLRVADTGVGIEPELLPRVFDFLVQGELRPEARDKRGLGLGLTLVKNLVELHGGTVDASSRGRGCGTTLTVRLPMASGPAIAAAPAAAPRLPVKVKRSIVVVEDNADVRQMMQLLLTKAGHSVEVAHDGPTGMETVLRVRPDFALVDLDLPGFDGCEVARRIRRETELAHVRLIALSGYGRPEDRARAIHAGFDEHLVKPIDFERLNSALLPPPAGA